MNIILAEAQDLAQLFFKDFNFLKIY
jgi:hypothetical protein